MSFAVGFRGPSRAPNRITSSSIRLPLSTGRRTGHFAPLNRNGSVLATDYSGSEGRFPKIITDIRLCPVTKRAASQFVVSTRDRIAMRIWAGNADHASTTRARSGPISGFLFENTSEFAALLELD